MLTVDEALAAVLDAMRPMIPLPRRLTDALGCPLMEDVTARQDLPPFSKALVDGYAVRTSDLEGSDRWLRLGEEIPAGGMPMRPLGPREAATIMTGAPIPPGADAVVMVEHTTLGEKGVLIEAQTVVPGQFILPKGGEMKAGEIVLRRWMPLNAARLGLLASMGIGGAIVIPRPRVAVMATGDELVDLDQMPGPGQIRNSNTFMLMAMAVACNAEAHELPIARDNMDALVPALKEALESGDIVLITGGVSAGRRDLVPQALEQLGVQRVFHQVRLKPGKPLWFGRIPEESYLGPPGPFVFGLPGNPVSGLVCFLLFVRPALEILAGRIPKPTPLVKEVLLRPFDHRGDRPTYHPARRVAADSKTGERAGVEPLAWAGSADLKTVAQADGFAAFPAGDRHYDAGETIDFLPLIS